MSIRTITVEQAAAAVLAGFQAAFGSRLAQIGIWDPADPVSDELQTAIITPALLLSLDALSVPDLTGQDGRAISDPWCRLPLRGAWSARCVLATTTPNLPVRLAEMAAATLAVLQGRGPELAEWDPLRGAVWGYPGAFERPENLDAQPAEFIPGLHGMDSWAVTWEQTFYHDGALPY
jgi:hypothetical protein